MESSELVDELYEAFSDCRRPEHFTDHEHCDECFEHDETMRKATLRSLSAVEMGTAGWSPLSFLTEEGFAYYMPRFMEMAVRLEKNRHGESFASHFLFHLAPSLDYDRFKNFDQRKCTIILSSLQHLLNEHRKKVVEEFIQEDLENAITYWKSRVAAA